MNKVFIGLETSADNLAAAKKRQNKITEYRRCCSLEAAGHPHTIAGYILGFPPDTRRKRSGATSRIIKEELPIDLLEFFCLTPLPGSEDHQTLCGGTASQWDGPQPLRCRTRLRPFQDEPGGMAGHLPRAWSLYYTSAHMKTLLRARRRDVSRSAISQILLTFSKPADRLEHIRCRAGSCASSIRPSAAPGLPVENAGCSGRALHGRRLPSMRSGGGDGAAGPLAGGDPHRPQRRGPMDKGAHPVGDDESETLDLVTGAGEPRRGGACAGSQN